MPYTLNSVVYNGFATQRVDTGFATFADTTPVLRVIRNGAVQATTVTVTPTAHIGAYTYTWTVPNAWADGDSIQVLGEATVNSVTGRAILDSFQLGMSGGGGSSDWTTMEKQQIRDALGVDGTKTTAVSGQLQTIKAKTDVLTFTGSDVNAVLNLSQVVPFAGSTNRTILQILRGTWGQSLGKWVINPSAVPLPTLTLYEPDGTTVLGVFDLSPTGQPYSTRTPQ